MRRTSSTESPRARILFGAALCAAGLSLAALGFAGTPPAQSVRDGSPAPAAATAGWSIVPSPNTSAQQSNLLNGVACASPSDCWAVGNVFQGSFYRTLIQHWDGNSWTITPSPNTSDVDFNNLFAVACASSTECWAVGYGTSFQTLILRWDGVSWSIVPTPNAGTRQNVLNAVTCSSANDCWAVGFYNAGPNKVGIFTYPSLVLHWNGSAWSIVSSANTRAPQNILSGVTCTAPSNCWAVGYTMTEEGGLPAQTFIEQWDGLSWKIVPSPNSDPDRNNYLFGVSCVSASDCRAAGYTNTMGMSDAQTLIEHWNGTAWFVEPSPNATANGNNALFGIACAGAANCAAVGYYNGANAIQTLIERWDGSAWTESPSPNTSGTQQNVLNFVTCTSAFNCWAVGYFNNASGFSQTVIQRYTASATPTITSVSRGANGLFIIKGEGLPLATIQIQATTNLLTTFTNLGTTVTNANGLFEYDDTGAGGMPRRFYHALYP